MMFKPKGKAAEKETELEIEEPGAANSVAEEGAKVMAVDKFRQEFEELNKARAKKENHIGQGGF